MKGRSFQTATTIAEARAVSLSESQPTLRSIRPSERNVKLRRPKLGS